MNRNVHCTNFFLALRTGLRLTPPPLEIIITVCHEKGRHLLPPNHYALFERPLRISSVNMTKSAENCGIGHIY